MSDNTPRGLIPFSGGFIRELVVRLKLVLRLMADNRVNPFLKILPIFSVVYLLVPMDMLPIFPVDDAAVLSLGMYLFVELCPQEVVEDHLKELKNVIPGELHQHSTVENVIDGDFQEMDEE